MWLVLIFAVEIRYYPFRKKGIKIQVKIEVTVLGYRSRVLERSQQLALLLIHCSKGNVPLGTGALARAPLSCIGKIPLPSPTEGSLAELYTFFH